MQHKLSEIVQSKVVCNIHTKPIKLILMPGLKYKS